ncbi:transcriptional protein SWT1-like [Panonychus citri]|uniref:transcriptional protein SWT1-like n=1 Tax=Panonychus citri TaxID=50023 RepID=UPI002307F80C|nr:transcriptional protein SWT1-like [Panonychus citri]
MDNDVDMMEIDDNDQLDHSKAFKRLPSGQTISTNKRTRDQVDCVVGPRKRIRGKRVTKRSSGKFILVLDTNILIDHLTDLKTFLSYNHLVESCRLIIPLVVIQELDTLKKSKQSYVQNFKFINEQLRAEASICSDKVWLKKHPPETVAEASAKVDLIEINNDDRILKSSLLINQVSEPTENTVILITDDLNLRNKALASALKSMDWDAFCDKFGIENTSCAKKGKTVERLRPTIKRLQTGTISKVEPTTSGTKNATSESPTDTMQFGDWLTLKYSTERKLKEFLEKILRKEYNDLWDKIFKIDFSNCSLFEIIRCIKQGWLGTFSDIFERDRSVLQTIETLFELLKNEKDTSQLTTLVYKLLQSIDEIDNKSACKRQISNEPQSKRKSFVT